MKKNYKQSIKIIILGLILSAGISLAFSQPASPYPANTDAPINVSTTPQAKGGPVFRSSPPLLHINGLLSSNGLAVFGNAIITGNLQVKSLIQTSVCANNLGKLISCSASIIQSQ